MTAKTIMIQGTASSVGKSLIATALCRLYRRKGLKVAPFKAQNMALNSAVTWEGHEIGRAQAAQAAACEVAASSLMNPVLLKPEGERRSQVIVRGVSRGSMQAVEYHQLKPTLRHVIVESLKTLMAQYDLVVIEGAGSPAEINLKDHDIVNMFVARSIQAPVLLVGDIDRGGVFASLVGTMELLTEEEKKLVAGFMINKFRGDPALLGNGLEQLHLRTGVPTLAVVPYLRDHFLAEEDSLSLEHVPRRWSQPRGIPRVAIIQLPRISNFDEFGPLVRCLSLDVIFTREKRDILEADLVIIPGTKNTLEDLQWLRAQGLDDALRTRLLSRETSHRNQWILGICGGCQMLGHDIDDSAGVETAGMQRRGLGYLPLKTVFLPQKRTVQCQLIPLDRTKQRGVAGPESQGDRESWLEQVFWGGQISAEASSGVNWAVKGYEIHAGQTFLIDEDHQHLWGLFQLKTLSPSPIERFLDGVVSPCGQVVGTMVHGIFENPGLPQRLSRWLKNPDKWDNAIDELGGDGAQNEIEATDDQFESSIYDSLAAHLENHTDMKAINKIIFGSTVI